MNTIKLDYLEIVEKAPHLHEVLKESDEIMNGFLKEIYAH